MSLALAQALAGPSHTAYADPVRDFKNLHRLAVWCANFSPVTGIDRELFLGFKTNTLEKVSELHWGITIDLTGTDRLHRNHLHIATSLLKRFSAKHVEARIALAPTIGAAWALSRFNFSPCSLAEGPLKEILADLPIQALRITDQAAEKLSQVGVLSLRDLFHLPRRTLSQRFGPSVLLRLEQLLGFSEEALSVVQIKRPFVVEQLFESPLTKRHSIMFVLRILLRKLFNQLKDQHQRARHFVLYTGGKNLAPVKKEFLLTKAIDCHKYFISIVEPLIEAMPFHEEVYWLRIDAKQLEIAQGEQRNLDARLEDEIDPQKIADTFSLRLGKDRVSIATLKESHIPERSFTHVPVHNTSQLAVTEKRPIFPFFNTQERPPVLYTKPEPITTIAMLPDRHPSFIKWRKIKCKVVSGSGPERISAEWWKANAEGADPEDRDYFKVQDEFGRWLWIFRNNKTMEWFIHGVWI